MPDADETLRPLERLEGLFEREAEKRAARVVHFSTIASRREVVVMLDLDGDLFLGEQEKETKDAFEEIERNFAVQRKDDQAVEAIQDLSDLERKLADPDEGIL